MKDESNLGPRPRSFPIIAGSSPHTHTRARAYTQTRVRTQPRTRSEVEQLISEAPLRQFAFSLADSFRLACSSPELTPA